MNKRFPVPATIGAVASVLVGAADAYVASRIRAPDTPGLIIVFIVLAIAAAQVFPFAASIGCGLYLRDAPSSRHARIAIALALLLGLPVFGVGLLALVSR